MNFKNRFQAVLLWEIIKKGWYSLERNRKAPWNTKEIWCSEGLFYVREGVKDMIEKERISKVISGWTVESGSMLPKSPQEILNYLETGTGVILWDENNSPAAFAAVTFAWPDSWKELGGVVVEPNHRQHGLGHEIVSELISKAKEKFPEAKFFALCNEKSLKIFLDNGAEIITDSNLLPSDVFGECVHCPKFIEAKGQGKICCDTPVIIK